MKTLRGLSLALISAAGLCAQYHGGYVNTRPRPMNPGANGARRFGGSSLGSSLVYASPVYVPVYIGGYGYGYGYDPGYGYGYDYDGTAAPPQQPSPAVYPPQPAPVIINNFGSGSPPPQTANPVTIYPPAQSGDQPDDTQPPEPTHYLIALKDHTVYSAIAYWVDGDTLHYFTSGNTHNQVSVSLVDRDLTKRLNEESGLEVKLPPAK